MFVWIYRFTRRSCWTTKFRHFTLALRSYLFLCNILRFCALVFFTFFSSSLLLFFARSFVFICWCCCAYHPQRVCCWGLYAQRTRTHLVKKEKKRKRCSCIFYKKIKIHFNKSAPYTRPHAHSSAPALQMAYWKFYDSLPTSVRCCTGTFQDIWDAADAD